MPAVTIIGSELLAFLPNLDPAQAQELVTGALARAAVVAPCIVEDDFTHAAAAKDIIRDAILRRAEAGTGAYSKKSVGAISVELDTRSALRALFQPGDVSELQALCTRYRGTSSAPQPSFSMPDSPLCDRGYRAAFGIRNAP